jgi:rhodanese-related sulfurtransferase
MKKVLSLLSIVTLCAAAVLAVQFSVHAVPRDRMLSAVELKSLMDSKPRTVAVFDANDDEVREQQGIVPGAKKLSSYDQYALTELPQDKSSLLVFYCYNWMCTASHSAAEKAIAAGYANVMVMSDGITGWKKKGLTTARP